MKTRIAIGIFAGVLSANAATFTGLITDSECPKGVPDHKKMQMATPDAKCVTECVKGMGGKYVLFDGKEAYTLSDQKTPEKFAAQKVTVTGALDAKTKTIKVDSIAAAK
jgi:hypothetical protein